MSIHEPQVRRGASRPVRHPSIVVLEPSFTPKHLELASRALVPYVASLCRRSINELREERVYYARIAKCEIWEDENASRLRTELEDIRRLLQDVSRMAKHPLPHTRREVGKLAGLLQRVPFASVTITRSAITVAVPALEEGRKAIGPFEICLAGVRSPRFPLFIRMVPGSDDSSHLAFSRFAGHGRCWGEAVPLIEAATERIDLSGLVLVALSWAKRNL